MDVYEEMAAKWPSAVIARCEVGKFTGYGISPKAMANCDSMGTGVTGRFMIGRRVVYRVEDFIQWLRENSKAVK